MARRVVTVDLHRHVVRAVDDNIDKLRNWVHRVPILVVGPEFLVAPVIQLR